MTMRMREVAPGIRFATDDPITPEEMQRELDRQSARDRRCFDADLAFAVRVLALGGRVEIDAAPVRSETGTTITAVFDIGPGQELRVRRAWAYLSAHVTTPLRCDGVGSPGYRLNHAPHTPQNPTHYSGGEMMLGSVCRAEGFAGGLFGDHFLSYCADGLGSWHVDDPDALGDIVRVLREVSRE
jgi:hypothetical protein